MSGRPEEQPRGAAEFDVVIVGAGFSGLFALQHLRSQGYRCRVFDAADGVGGTWYWNRYPGARVDLESVEYSYAWSSELEQDWEWSERYASQEELLRYLNHVADRFDLRRDIQLGTRIVSAVFDDLSSTWLVTTDRGDRVRASYLVAATGFTSAPNKIPLPGLEQFEGEVYFSGEWPHDPVDFAGKRVGIIGTGSSGVQMIPLIAAEALDLVVFQRTAGYAVPLRNQPMDPDYLARVRRDYAEWRRREWASESGFIALNFHWGEAPKQLASEVSEEERLAEYATRWRSGGLSLANGYRDLYVDRAMNATLADFVRDKIRERISDPDLATKLVPSEDLPILVKRLMAETGYYESFEKYDITLVDLRSDPIEGVTPKGIMAGGREYEMDCLVMATGYDAVTGALTRMDIRGRGGRSLREHWSNGLRTHLGLMVAGFPNMFMIDGPGSPCAFFQPVLLQEYQVRWVADALKFLHERDLTAMEPTEQAEQDWVDHSARVAEGTLFSEVKSWYRGSNIPGKPEVMLLYVGGFPRYRRALDDARGSGYPGHNTWTSALTPRQEASA